MQYWRGSGATMMVGVRGKQMFRDGKHRNNKNYRRAFTFFLKPWYYNSCILASTTKFGCLLGLIGDGSLQSDGGKVEVYYRREMAGL